MIGAAVAGAPETGALVRLAAGARHSEKLWLAGLTLSVWALAPLGEFQFDDFPNIVLEPSTFDLSRATGLRWLSRLSLFVDHAVWGMSPRGFLITNLLLHVASVLCVHSLATSLQPRAEPQSRAAFLAAALFALQPANAEVVAYASGRATGLMALLLLGGLALRARGRTHAGLALLGLSCLAKETALVFPLLLWLRERDTRSLAKATAVALGLLALLACVPRYRELAAWSLAARDPAASLALNLSVLPAQLSLWLRPWALSVEHAVDLSPSAAAVCAGGALVAALALAAFAARRREPLTSFAIAWMLVCLIPTSTLIARADPISERALYLAWVGPAIALGDALARLVARVPVLAPAAALALALSAVLSWQRVEVWSDARLLWADAVAKAPNSSRAWNNLGMAFLTHGEPDRSRDAFQSALARDAGNSTAQANLRRLGAAGADGYSRRQR